MSDSPDPVTQGSNLTLTANNVADSDGTVAKVEFYRESNGQSGLQTGAGGDTLVGDGTQSGSSWSWNGSTAGFPLGSNTYYARAQDDDSTWSNTASTTGTVTSPAGNLIQWDGGPLGTGTAWSNP